MEKVRVIQDKTGLSEFRLPEYLDDRTERRDNGYNENGDKYSLFMFILSFACNSK